MSTPYIDPEEKRRQEEKDNKKKWITRGDFLKFVGKATLNKPRYIPNFVNLTPSDSAINYKFRMDRKEKWIAPKNFMSC